MKFVYLSELGQKANFVYVMLSEIQKCAESAESTIMEEYVE